MSKIHNGIQYAGVPGSTQECLDGIMRLVQYGDHIERARILSASNMHGLLLSVWPGDLVAIKSGFASGYGGEGPHKLSYALQLLEAHKTEIEEYEVGKAMLNRLDRGTLTIEDIEKIDAMRPVRPNRYHGYINESHYERSRDGRLWSAFKPVVPFGIIDSRLWDLAISFWDNPDDKLMRGYRRLEDIVRERIGSTQHSSKLFSEAFLGKEAKLRWKNVDDGEKSARGTLFTGAYGAHRNPRAHKESPGDRNNQLSEFLLLNHLYLLEKDAMRE
jgi:Protein of unknown function (Hypoth_ymh)